MARIGVVTFPGSLDDRDAARAVRLADGEAVNLFHTDADLQGVDAVVLPGGFSYGDYLRAGAISRFSPIMERVVDAARGGMPVLGICNGFQVLTEVHLLPGSMIKNEHLHFVCRDQVLRVENASTAWTGDYEAGQEITAVRGEAVRSWDEINLRLIADIGFSGELTIQARDDDACARHHQGSDRRADPEQQPSALLRVRAA